jgi:hypothetical protein
MFIEDKMTEGKKILLKVPFPRKTLAIYLLATLIYLLWGTYSLVAGVSTDWIAWAWIGLGIIGLGLNAWQFSKPYILLDSSCLIQYNPHKKRIDLTEIHSIKPFADELIIRSAKKEIRVNSKMMD